MRSTKHVTQSLIDDPLILSKIIPVFVVYFELRCPLGTQLRRRGKLKFGHGDVNNILCKSGTLGRTVTAYRLTGMIFEFIVDLIRNEVQGLMLL